MSASVYQDYSPMPVYAPEADYHSFESAYSSLAHPDPVHHEPAFPTFAAHNPAEAYRAHQSHRTSLVFCFVGASVLLDQPGDGYVSD